jgi:hypothetical protein
VLRAVSAHQRRRLNLLRTCLDNYCECKTPHTLRKQSQNDWIVSFIRVVVFMMIHVDTSDLTNGHGSCARRQPLKPGLYLPSLIAVHVHVSKDDISSSDGHGIPGGRADGCGP